MHPGIILHLAHLAHRQYQKFFTAETEKMLKSKIFSGGSRRSVLQCKTIGLIHHDRVLTQDSRLPDCLKLEH